MQSSSVASSQSASPVLRDVVLVGGGHSHVGVLKAFGMHPIPGVRLTVVCTDAHTPYSGMLPGYIAGHYSYDQVHIDLSRLCVFARARFIHAEVTGIDRSTRRVLLRDRPSIAYDVLSINIGSTPQMQNVPGAQAHAVPVKPIYQFNQRWLALLERTRQHIGPTTIAIVGGGAGGVELCLAMQYRLRNELTAQGRDPKAITFHLFTSEGLLPTHNARVQKRFGQVLQERGVQVHSHSKVTEVAPGKLHTGDGAWLEADEVLWVTQAGGAAWLQSTGLALDAKGFLRVNSYLQSISDPLVFAAGDVASIEGHALEKAGVFAVRMARPLALNLRRTLRGDTLKPYRPQTQWLALISTGDKFAVASRGIFSAAGHWVWRWKDRIDQRFMQRFSPVAPMPTPQFKGKLNAPGSTLALGQDESQEALSAQAMRCGGCGAKVGADVLGRALKDLQPLQHPDVLMGLNAPDDAAIVRLPEGKALAHTVDFFRAMVDDPYLFGQIAANHALGDIFAMGAVPHTATAIATLPPGLQSKVQEDLRQLMSGAIAVLNDAGCALVGGHTGEGSDLSLGFAITGLVDASLTHVLRKSGMRAGDVLILTKPLGTGTLMAAHARMQAKGRWVQGALHSMTQSNMDAANILRAHGATACTDVTGFGLLGHLLEMTRASSMDAQLWLNHLPVLEGALPCLELGIFSSLHAANLRQRSALQNPEPWAQDPRQALLFDPQTAGGLLASVPANQAAQCVKMLQVQGFLRSAAIGQVMPQSEATGPIELSIRPGL
jgi:selenide,water dikinase